ncbi:MAG: BolA family protein [Pseudomonadota bacterium]
MGPLERSINRKLRDSFAPLALEVINESHLHAGHQGGAVDGTGETHFRVRITSEAFQAMTRLQRHRAVNELLAEELANGVHALAVEPSAP